MPSLQEIRIAIREALPREPSAEAADLRPGIVYFPPSHVKALQLESSLVVGGRGVGKTFWTWFLGNTALRNGLAETRNTDVRIGHAVPEQPKLFPSKDTISKLLIEKFTAESIWTAVLVRWLATIVDENIPMESWSETTQWVQNNPEHVSHLLQQANISLQKQGMRGLIVFDALDRTSDDWETMNNLVRGLLKMILRLKSYKFLFGKVFLREDQLTQTVINFPDASKLQMSRCDLIWELHDLHGLLWKTLCNAPGYHGDILRELYREQGASLEQIDGIYFISSDAQRQTDLQKRLFHALAGSKMGKGERRGVPYLWTVGHLADSHQHTSPRSFLLAIQRAADDSLERDPLYIFPLHYESIKRGVQAASGLRVDEITEDYPWVKRLFAPLRGQFNVPVEFFCIEALWAQAFPKGFGEHEKLPVEAKQDGWRGLLQQLQHLGVCSVKKDGRIDMPDLYRVAFSLGRKGGVKPVNRAY